MYAVVDKGEPTENRSKDEAETSGENGINKLSISVFLLLLMFILKLSKFIVSVPRVSYAIW